MKYQMRNFCGRLWVFFFILPLLYGCSGSGSQTAGTSTGNPNNNYMIAGAAQKGPFIKGAEVLVNYLTQTGLATGETIVTETLDSIGNFEFESTKTGAVQIVAEGYHLNELTGNISNGTLLLRGIYEITESGSQSAYVNVMTHLINDRVLELLKTGEKTVPMAIEQAQQELLDTLSGVIPNPEIDHFTSLSIYDVEGTESAGNGYLLALSSAIYQYATNKSIENSSSLDAELALVLNELSSDLAPDGDIDSNEILSQLSLALLQLDPNVIEQNLTKLSTDVLTESLNVPDIMQYVNQFILAYPAEGSQLTDATIVKLAVPSQLNNVSFQLLVDGEFVAEAKEKPYEFSWNPYYWSNEETHTLLVKAIDDSGFEIFSNLVNVSVLPAVNALLIIVGPEDSAQIKDSNNALLEWQALTGAKSYEVQIGSDYQFNNLVSAQQVTETTFQTGNLQKGTYYWRIHATNDLGKTGIWSTVYSFTISGPDPVANLTSSGTVYVSLDDYDVSLIWSPVNLSDYYEIEIAKDENFQQLVYSSNIAQPGETTTLKLGLYYWRVRAVNTDGIAGDWSDGELLNVGLFTYRIGRAGDESAVSFERTSDGGYVIAGRTYSLSHSYFYLVKLNAEGEILWEKTFGDRFWNTLYAMKQTPDEGFILVGMIEDLGAGYTNAYIVKTDPDGNEEWNQVLGDTASATLASGVAILQDGYLVTYRKTDSYISETTVEIGTTKLDQQGNILWSNIIEQPAVGTFNWINSIEPTQDGNFIIAGDLDWNDVGEVPGAFLVKIDNAGTPLWSSVFADGLRFLNGSDAIETSDQGYVIVGIRVFPGAVLLKTDPMGFEQSSIHDPNLIMQGSGDLLSNTSDGGFVLVASDGYHPLMLKFSVDCTEEWRNTFTGFDYQVILTNIKQDKDGGFIILGNQNSAVNDDLLLFKTNMEGETVE